MTLEQGLVYGVIGLTLVMLAFELWRYDLVALMGMLLLVVLGTVSVEEAFAGFGDPAVITIAAVLVVSQGLQNTGVVDQVAKRMSAVGDRLGPQLMVLCGLVILSSGFMNNIAALAIFIPVAVRIARRGNRSPSLYLLPMAFSAHLGGLITLIGMPTNLIVSELRAEYVGERFGMFAFAPVGLAVSIVGVAFIALAGWHLIPRREGGRGLEAGFTVADYLAEVGVPEESEVVGTRLRDLRDVSDADVWVAAILRNGERLSAPAGSDRILAQDTLLVRGETEDLRQFVREAHVELAESKPLDEEAEEADTHAGVWEALKSRLQADDVETVEAVVRPDSMMVGKTARDVDMRARYGVNLLGVSRCDEELCRVVGATPLEPGDVLLVQGHHKGLSEALENLGLLPLAEREIHLESHHILLGVGIFLAALLTASLSILSVPVAMTAAAVGMVVGGVVSLREAYRHIEWPIIVLFGAMFAMGAAMEGTGGDQLIADQILRASDLVSPAVLMVVILLVTMLLSNIVNNAAAVVLMASIAVSVARGLGASIDLFLVAVAVGSACAFLTPIGHEANVLVFEPGGYEFSDYWRLGLPLTVLMIAVSVPLLLWLWPI
ncbi:MAG: SLC13 family permease [Anaerolineae bacterium]